MNKFFAILIILSLSLPVLAIEELESSIEPQKENVVEEVLPETTVNTAPKQDLGLKQPISKKKLAKKFIIAMLCVAGTSILLYGTLSIYNKFRDNILSQGASLSDTGKQLDTPTDLTEAIKTFIDKTRWDEG